MKATSSTRFLVAIIGVISILGLLGFKLLDPKAKNPNFLLKKAAPHLDKLGIDVVQDCNSAVITQSSTILAPLADWMKHRNSQSFEEEWFYEFESGYIGSIQAIESADPINENAFLARWLAT